MSFRKSRKGRKYPVSIKRGSSEVKIYRTISHGCESFVLSFYQDGKRRRHSFSSFEKAKTEAEFVANRLGSADAAVLKLVGADLNAYRRARQILDPLDVPIEVAASQFSYAKTKLGGVPLSEAVEFFLKRHPKRIEPRRIRNVVDELLKTKKAMGLSNRYLDCLVWALGKFARAFNCNIGDVTGLEIDAWLQSLELSPRTRNNLRNSLQTLFSFAKSRHYLPKDHDELGAVPLAKVKNGKIEIFTPSELTEILAVAGAMGTRTVRCAKPYLGRLAKKHSKRVISRRKTDERLWLIKRAEMSLEEAERRINQPVVHQLRKNHLEAA